MADDDWEDPFADPADDADAVAAAEEAALKSKEAAAIGAVKAAEALAAEELEARKAAPFKPTVLTVADMKLPRSLPALIGRKIRMLCLHGSCSNSKITKMQMMTLESMAREFIEFVYVDGSCASSGEGPAGELLHTMEATFPAMGPFCDYARNPTVDGVPNSHTLVRRYDGLDEAVEHLRAEAAKFAPIDGIWGFAQGANIGTILVAEGVTGRAPEFADVRFGVHISGAIPGWKEQRPDIFADPLCVPNLVVGGGPSDIECDGQPRQSFRICELYAGSQVLEHNDGHCPFPRNREEKATYCRKMLDFICEACS